MADKNKPTAEEIKSDLIFSTSEDAYFYAYGEHPDGGLIAETYDNEGKTVARYPITVTIGEAL